MKKSLMAFYLVMTTFVGVAQAQTQEVFWNAENLQADKECLLQIVRAKMGVTKKTPAPRVRLESTTPFNEYQDAMEKWWGLRPDVFVNVYDAPNNTIYLTNNMKWYKSPRTPVDSLVHELTHFVQVQDQNGASGDEDLLEADAVKVQTWFRETHSQFIGDEKYQGACQ